MHAARTQPRKPGQNCALHAGEMPQAGGMVAVGLCGSLVGSAGGRQACAAAVLCLQVVSNSRGYFRQMLPKAFCSVGTRSLRGVRGAAGAWYEAAAGENILGERKPAPSRWFHLPPTDASAYRFGMRWEASASCLSRACFALDFSALLAWAGRRSLPCHLPASFFTPFSSL